MRPAAVRPTAVRQLVIAGLTAPIRFYRRFLSPLTPPSCRFHPTCSTYALEAIATHGPVRGPVLAVRRLLRCHPITWLGGSSGLDPVPQARRRSS
jgi:putative membrane protein insertion efficiency factor